MKQLKYRAAAAAVGNAGGADVPMSIIPFLLRGVSLLGIDSVLQPYERRVATWARLVRDLDLDRLEAMIRPATLAEVPDLGAGDPRGRDPRSGRRRRSATDGPPGKRLVGKLPPQRSEARETGAESWYGSASAGKSAQRHRWQAEGWASLEAGDPVFGIALAVATFAAIAGVTAGVRQARGWGSKARVVGHAAVGAAAALLVFLLQSVSVGASLGGAILVARGRRHDPSGADAGQAAPDGRPRRREPAAGHPVGAPGEGRLPSGSFLAGLTDEFVDVAAGARRGAGRSVPAQAGRSPDQARWSSARIASRSIGRGFQ